VHLDAHIDLVVKNGITAVRGPSSPANGSDNQSPQSLNSGLWLMPSSLVLPGERRWWPGGGRVHKAKRRLDQAVVRREPVHLLINGLALAERGRFALSGIEQTVRRASRLRAQGRLDIATLAEVAERLSNSRPVAPSRSILRPAA
jgi:hypothetical protein